MGLPTQQFRLDAAAEVDPAQRVVWLRSVCRRPVSTPAAGRPARFRLRTFIDTPVGHPASLGLAIARLRDDTGWQLP